VGKRGLAGVLIVLAVAASVWYWTSWCKSSVLASLRLRVADLRGRVEKQRAASPEAVDKYQPQDTGRVDDRCATGVRSECRSRSRESRENQKTRKRLCHFLPEAS
jgi:hypothetical protein